MKGTQPKSAIYMRFGTAKQIEGSITALYCRVALANDERIAEQEKTLRRYANSKTFGIYGCYCDNGASGNSADRPELQRLITDIKSGKVKRIVVLDITRIARNFTLTNELMKFFDKNNVEVIFVSDNFNNSTQTGNLLDGEFERIIQENYKKDCALKAKSAKFLRQRKSA
jgi:DNA invertase Pin-like site-specific DNA recombinase